MAEQIDTTQRDDDSHRAAQRAVEVLRAMMGFISEMVLDLDVTWPAAREVFAQSLFEHARDRHGSGTRVAAALDTAKRTAQRYLGPGRDTDLPDVFNMRRRVLLLLQRGPLTLDQIEAEVPHGSDVNYAKSAVKSLVAEGLATRDRRTKAYRLVDEDFEPWYLRAELHGVHRVELAMHNLARIMGSRYTPRLEQAAEPGTSMCFFENLPGAMTREYADALYDTLVRFDAEWEERADRHRDDPDQQFVGGFFAFGRIGPGISEEERRRMLKNDPRELPFDDSVAPTYRRYQDEAGRYVTLPDDDDRDE